VTIIRLIKHKKVILSKLFPHAHVALNESKRIRFTMSVNHIPSHNPTQKIATHTRQYITFITVSA
jgi:hypothetical protein